MAEVAKVGTPSYSSLTPPQGATIVGLFAGETIAPGDACYIRAADGLVLMATGAANNAAADVAGFSFGAASVGDPITLVDQGNFRYGSNFAPSTKLFLSGTVPGGLADAASTGGLAPIAVTIDATRIRLLQSGMWA